MKRLVIIPTYNEKPNISKLVSKLQSLKIEGLDILFIDDNSPDGTGKILKSFQKDNPNLLLIERESKLGLGTAYIMGFKYGLENGYDYITRGVVKEGKIVDIIIPGLPRPLIEVRDSEKKKDKEYLIKYKDMIIFVDVDDPWRLL